MGNSPSSGDDGGGEGDGNDEGGTGRSRPGLTTRGLSHRIVGGGSNNNSNRAGLPHLTLPSSLPSPFRSGGSLGLSRSELDAKCQPSGLYESCEWEPKQIRRLISNGQLAARLKGSDARLAKTDRECPICFMYYSESNVTKCCNATVCTECYLQIKSQKDRNTTCPFCNNPKMTVTVQRLMDECDVAKREEDEQRVIEATIKSRRSRLHGEEGPVSDDGSPGAGGGEHGDSGETASQGSFGSSLENYNRAQTLSASSNNSGSDVGAVDTSGNNPPGIPIRPGESDAGSEIMSLAMSPADRRALESEMRAQLSHETHRRMETEAEEARMRHTQEWYGSQTGSRSRMREARLAELTGLLERMGARGGGGGAGANNDDGEGENPLMAMGADTRGLGSRPPTGNGLSRLLQAIETSSSTRSGAGARSIEDLMRVTAISPEEMVHNDRRRMEAADLMSRLHRASFIDAYDGNETAAATARAVAHRQERNIAMSGLLGRNNIMSRNYVASDDATDGLGGRGLGRASSNPFGIGSAGAGGSAGHRRVVRRHADNRGVSTTHLDTAELLMRGVSEEEQLAMAIAMSMQDAQETQQEEGVSGGDQQSAATGASAADGGAETGGLEEESGGQDDDSSSSSGSSSSDSSVENLDQETSIRAGGANNTNNADNDDDEEEVVFTDLASV